MKIMNLKETEITKEFKLYFKLLMIDEVVNYCKFYLYSVNRNEPNATLPI